MTPRVVIQDERQEKRRRLWIAGAAAAAFAFAWALYALGRSQASDVYQTYQVSEQRADTDMKRLSQLNRQLREENRALNARIVTLQRSSDVDTAAGGELRQALAEMQAQVAESKKELAFYRGILSPEEAKAGVRVQQFTLGQTQKERTYTFDLILIQSARHDKSVKGDVKLRVDGLRNDEAISITWDKLVLDSKPNIVFSFKYFQELTGTFRIPENFEPTLVELEVVPRDRSKDSFVDRFDWDKLTSNTG